MPKYKVGAIYKFHKPFTDREDDLDAKERYFLYLGNTSEFVFTPITVYVVTSTTQIKQYEKDGDKENSNYIKFTAGTFGFTKDCIICFDELKTYMTEPIFESYKPEEIDVIKDKELLKRIYDKILQSKRIPKIIKRDIHDCFNKIVTGLKLPK